MRKMLKQKMFQRFLLSYLFVLMLPLLITGTVITWYNSQLLTEKAQQASYQNLIQAKLLADREFSELREIAIQIGRNQDIRKVMFEQDPIEWQYARWKALDELMLTNASKQFPEEIQVYFKRNQEFLNASSYYDAQLFYQKYPIDGKSAEEFVEWVSTNELVFTQITTHNGKNRYLLYSSSIPISEGQSSGAVLMFINWEKLQPLFSSSIGVGIEKYDFILGLDGEILYSSDAENLVNTSELLNNLKNQEGLTENTVGGQKYLVVVENSDLMPLRYVSITAMNDVLESVGAMRLNLVMTLLVCLAFGMVFVYFLSRRNYQPIQNLLEYVESGDRKQYRRAYDEFGKIVDKMDMLFSENQLLEQSIRHQIPNLRLSFVGNLLAGRYTDAESIVSLEEMLDIHFESEHFCVVMTRIEDYSAFTPQQDEKNLSLVNFALTNVFLELMESIALVLDLQVHKQKTFLLCFRREIENPQRKLEEQLEQFHQFVTHLLKLKVSVGASEVCNSIDEIPRCNEQAQQALNRRFLYGYGCVSVYKPEDLTHGIRYYYPIDKETQLINRMKQGDAKGALEIAGHLFSENIEVRQLPLQLSYCMMFNLLGTVLKVLGDVGIEYDITTLTSQMLESMLRRGTIRELYHHLSVAIEDICLQVQQSRESGNIQLRNRIAQYLEENYMDSNLSLLWIADQFHLSGPYLSRYFKDQMGMNFADYLCRLRITKAKELMCDETLSISEISARVGYNSSNSFIRTFKRYESVTPGQYREQKHTVQK